MKVEVFYADGCGNCGAALQALKDEVLTAFPSGTDWRELDVVEHIDHAVDVGVLSVPAVVIDGALVFAKLPTPEQLLAELNARLHRA